MSARPQPPRILHIDRPNQPFRWRYTTPAQRRVVLAASLGWMLDAFDVMLYSIVVVTLMRQFGMSKATAGLLNALTLVASTIGGLGFGYFADRLGRRRMLNLSILTYSIFTFACGLSTTIAMLAVCRFLLGLGMGGEWNTGAALVAETWPTAWRGRALGIVQSSWAVGYALAAVAASLVLAHGGWRWVFFLGVLPAFAVFWIRREVPEPPSFTESRRLTLAESAEFWRPAFMRLLPLMAMNTFGMFAWWGLFTWIPAYLVLPAHEGGRGFGMFSLTWFLVILNLAGMLPGYQLFGIFADRYGRKRMLVIYLSIATLAVPCFALARAPWLILVTACLAAFFGTGFFTGSGIVGSELFPTPIRATALGVSYNIARGFSALAPFLIGYLGQRHSLAYAFLASALGFALAALSALLLPETGHREIV